MIRIRYLVPIVLLVSQTNVPAQAQGWVSEEYSEVVSYSDLDLHSPQGLATLDGRISSAVRRVCRKAFPDDVRTSLFMRRCHQEAEKGAKLQRDQAIAGLEANKEIRFTSRKP